MKHYVLKVGYILHKMRIFRNSDNNDLGILYHTGDFFHDHQDSYFYVIVSNLHATGETESTPVGKILPVYYGNIINLSDTKRELLA